MIKVVIVEDNLHFISSWIKMLETSDLFQLCGIYSSAEEAVPNLLAYQPDIAIIAIPLLLVSGISLIKKIGYKIPGTKFLLSTSKLVNNHATEVPGIGAAGFLLYDYSAQQLKDTLWELFMRTPLSDFHGDNNVYHSRRSGDNKYGLSTREQEVLNLIAKGLLYKEIGEKLAISNNTVKNHLKSSYKKLGVQSKIEAINKLRSN